MIKEPNTFCCNQDELKGLRYDGMSLVYIQIFSVEQSHKEKKTICELLDGVDKNFITEDLSAIDQQIFIYDPAHRPVHRYKLKGFDFLLHLDEPYEVTVSGHIYVEMSVFFNKTVSLTYRMVIDGEYCQKSDLLTTDHLIEMISLSLGAEHWSSETDEEATNINLEINDINISNLYVNKYGEWIVGPEPEKLEKTAAGRNSMNEVFIRYKKNILRSSNDILFSKKKKKADSSSRLHDMNYAFVDVWESVKHFDNLFSTLKEENIISHIFEEHKKELVGLMSLYPAEWPYRTLESFDDVCGSNIAIDTDDLILANQNVCVVFGTYGLRGGKESPTDWAEHLKERSHYHVSWPEYLLILEMILAKKYTVMYANDRLLDSVLSDAYSNPERSIENNATLNLEITKLLMELDAVKYSKFVSHKIMFDRTMERLSIEAESQKLESMMERVDNSLTNISEARGVKQGTLLNIILGGISVASLFEIVFQDLSIPLFSSIGVRSDRVSSAIIWLTIFLIVTGLLTMFAFMLAERKNHKRKK